MTTPIKVLLVCLAALLWFIFGGFMINSCNIFSNCCGCETLVDRDPLVYNWDSDKGLTNEKFPAYKSEIIQRGQEGEILEITGYYFSNEKNTSEFENMGLARANNAKRLFTPDVATDRIRLRALMIEPSAALNMDSIRKNYLKATEFDWKTGLPIYSNWKDSNAQEGPGFSAFHKELMSRQTENSKLEITGLYYADEENTSEFANMGLARAQKVKEMFLEAIDEDIILLNSRQIGETDGVRENDFLAANVDWREGTRTIEELEDRVVIRFPFNSVKKDFDPAVDEYLDRLAKKLKTDKGKVSLTGHTDNIGGKEANEKLGMRRAKMIRDILIKKGVKRSQITTYSKGENQPASSNDTEEGRHDNRRTVVRVIK